MAGTSKSEKVIETSGVDNSDSAPPKAPAIEIPHSISVRELADLLSISSIAIIKMCCALRMSPFTSPHSEGVPRSPPREPPRPIAGTPAAMAMFMFEEPAFDIEGS